MKFIDKYYADDKFRSNPCGTWCPYQLGYEEAPKEKYKCPEAVRDYSCHACWDREMPEPKPEPANKFPGFEINDIVMTRGGRLCIILPNAGSKDNKGLFYTYNIKNGYGSGLSCLAYCSDYTDNVYTTEAEKGNDIVKLWRCTPYNSLGLIGDFFNKGKISRSEKPIWEEQPLRKMTLEEILKEIKEELGYQVEIISEPERKENKL